MLLFTHLLLQIGAPNFAGSDNASRFLVNAGRNQSEAIAAAWDNTWQVALSGGLYHVLNNFGIFIAAGSLALWTLHFARRWLEDEANGFGVFQELIYPIIVILLLTNGGSNLASLSLGMRNIINTVNNQVLEVVAQDIDLEQTMAELSDYASAVNNLAVLRGQCNTITQNDKLTKCLSAQAEAAKGVLSVYQKQHPGTPLFQKLSSKVQVAAKDPGAALQSAAAGTGEAAQGVAIKTVNIALSPILAVVEIFMVALQAAFQQLIEVSLLLTALMGPIAVGASLLPFGAKPVYAWLTAFWSLGLLKLAYNVMCGLTAISIYKIGGDETLASAIFFGLLSPILAIAMAAGGGTAIFNGILAAATAATGLAASQAQKASLPAPSQE